MKLATIPLDVIDPPTHAHRLAVDQDALAELAQSIAAHGLLNPIHVRRRGERYEIVAGHRRYLAHHQLRRTEIEAFLITGKGNGTAQAAQFAENMHRAQLTPMEEAYALRRQIEDEKQDPAHLARMLNRSTRWITDRLALTDLPAPLQDALHAKLIATAAALALAQVDNEQHLTYLLDHAIKGGASVPVIQSWVHEYINQRDAAGADPLPPPDTTQEPRAAILLMPCAVCDEQQDYLQLRILRVCAACTAAIRK